MDIRNVDVAVICVFTIVIVSAMISIMLHEGFHILAAKEFGAHVVGIRLRRFRLAVLVDQTGMPTWVSVPIAVAGPAADCLVIVSAVALHLLGVLSIGSMGYAVLWPSISVLVNVVPIGVTDGGRVLRYFAERRLKEVRA